MQDPRALANFDNLKSYRAWSQQALQQSGFIWATLAMGVSTPWFVMGVIWFEHVTRGARSSLLLIGAAAALFMVASLGSMVLGMLRLKAWKQAHPWSPPARRASWGGRPAVS